MEIKGLYGLAIICVWSAFSIIYALLIWLGAAYSLNPMQWLIDMKNDFFITFVIALTFTGAIALLARERNQR